MNNLLVFSSVAVDQFVIMKSLPESVSFQNELKKSMEKSIHHPPE